jgi:ComF family protein
MAFEYDGIARAGVYDGALRDMILAFKFNDRVELAGMLGEMTAAAYQGCTFKDRIDVITPVPLHWKRKLKRGFNQATILGKAVRSDGVTIIDDLVRTRNTERQWSLSPAKRKKNVKGAFAVRKDHRFKGRNILLVDDITTSGATLNECAKTLKQAGAKKVYALVTAVAMQDK